VGGTEAREDWTTLRRELILAAIVVLSLVLWVGGSAFVSGTTVALVAISLMLIQRRGDLGRYSDDKRA